MLGSVPWWQKFSPSLLYIPTGTGLVLIKTLWLMDEHIKLFSPHRLQSHTDLGDLKPLKDWYGRDGTSILRLFLEVTSHCYFCLDIETTLLLSVGSYGAQFFPSIYQSFLLLKLSFLSYVLLGLQRVLHSQPLFAERALGTLFFVPKKVSDKMLCV